MQRRELLAAGTIALFAGCVSDGSDDEDGGDADTVTLDSEGVSADAPEIDLSVRFNSRTSTRLQPGERATLAEEGYKWVIVRMDVTNNGADELELPSHQFVLEDGETYEVVGFNQHNLRGVRAPPGDVVTGWVAYHVPVEVTAATLTAKQEYLHEDLAVDFVQDDSLDVSWPD